MKFGRRENDAIIARHKKYLKSPTLLEAVLPFFFIIICGYDSFYHSQTIKPFHEQ